MTNQQDSTMQLRKKTAVKNAPRPAEESELSGRHINSNAQSRRPGLHLASIAHALPLVLALAALAVPTLSFAQVQLPAGPPYTTVSATNAASVAIGDMDGDGFAEIAIGATLYDHNGNRRFQGSRGTGSTGHGPSSVLADVDGQPGLELARGDGPAPLAGQDIVIEAEGLADLGHAVAEIALREDENAVGGTGRIEQGHLH